MNFLKQPCHFWVILLRLVLYIANTVLYQVSYQARLPCQKSHSYRAGYVMQKSKCIGLQIMCNRKSVLRSWHSIAQGTTQNNCY